MSKSGQAASVAALNQQQNLINAINATGKFSAEMQKVSSTTETFTNALEKNKLSMSQYFRYAGASTKSFGRLFKSEFDTINKVARERVKDLQTQYIKMGRDANGAMKAIAIRPLTLDMENLGTKTAIAAQKQQLLNQLLKQGSTNLLNFGKNTQWAGRQLMVGFSVPLMYFGTQASRTFMQLEEQAIRFKRVYGEIFTGQEETDAMLTQVQALAKEFTKYGVAVSDTMQMAADAAASGKMGADLIAQVNEATRLSVLGQVEQQQALETTISLTNAFGISSDQLRNKINFLNAVENQTVVSIEDLTTAIPKAGPVVQQLGGNVEDLAFFLTAMKEGGINASEGANALKSGLAALINPTAKASEMLGNFGVNITGIVEANKGDIKGTVIDFAKALDTLDPLTRSRAIEQLFGKFQFARLSTLFENVTKQGGQAGRVLEITRATTEELAILSERELKRVEDSPMYKFKKTVEDLKVSIAPVGAEFLKAITPIADFFRKILDSFNGFSDGTKKTIVVLTTVIAGIGPLFLMTFGLLANGLANIIKLFASLKGGYNRLGKDSLVLGEQTSYMTQEQLRAASVAASLEQTHSKLIQTFTSETAAINTLTQALSRAVQQQRNFTGIGVAGSSKTRKYAGGVLSVPGPKGAGDVVPAMLSPGESVIPARQTNKYGGLIRGIIADNIPGYAEGLEPIGKGFKNATMYMPESWNTMMGGSGQGILTKQLTAYMEKAGSSVMAPLMAVMAKSMGMKVNDPKVRDEWARVGQQLTNSAVTALNNSGKEFIKDEDLEEIVVPALKRTAKGLSVAGKELSKELDRTVNEIHTVGQVGTQSGAKKGAGRTALDRLSYRNIREDAQSFALTQNPEMFSRRERFSKTKQRMVNSFQTFDTELKQWEVATMSHITKSVTTTVKNLINTVAPYLGDQSARIVKATTKAVVDGAKQELKVASPSKEAKRVGQETGKGFIQGATEGVQKAKAAGSTAVMEKSRNSLYGSGPVDPIQKSIRRQMDRQARLQVISEKSAIREGRLKGMVGRGVDNVPTRIGKFGSMAQTGMMGASGVAMVGSMVPGKVGDLFQKLLGPLMAISLLLPLVQSKMGAFGIGIGLLAASVVAVRMAFDSAQDAALKLGESIGSGSKSMEELSKFAGKVSASEIMSRRRDQQFSPFQIQTGKSTFGESYVASETGKASLSGFGSLVGSQGRGVAKDQLTNQLISAIVSKAISPDQARSIAANMAKQLGDYNLGIEINGKITDIVGPNGENLAKDPLKVRVQLLQDTRSALAVGSKNANKSSGYTGRDAGNSAKFGLGGAIAGGLGGAMAAGAIAGAAGGSVAPVVGTAIGAGVGLVGGLIYAQRDRQKRIGTATGANIALQKIALEQQQSMLDSLTLEYEQRIDIAKSSGDATEAARLSVEYETSRNAILKENAALLSDIKDSYKGASGDVQKALITGADKAVTKTYAGTALEDVAPLAQDLINNSGISKENQLVLKLEMASSQIDPMQIVNLFETIGKDKANLEAVINVVTKFGGATGNDVVTLLNGFTDKNTGKAMPDLQRKFLADISTKTPKEAEAMINLFSRIVQSGQILNAGMAIQFYLNNPKAAEKLQGIIDKVNEKKGLIDLKVATEILGAGSDELAALMTQAKEFEKLKPEHRKVFIQALVTELGLQGDPTQQKAFELWQKVNPGMGPGDYFKFAASEALRLAQSGTVDTTTSSETPGPTTPKTIDASPLDSLVKRFKELRNIQVSYTKGWTASKNAINSIFSGNKIVTGFKGIEQQIRAAGGGQDLIDLVVGMDKEEYAKWKNSLFKFNKGNIVELTTLAKNIGRITAANILGEKRSSLTQEKDNIKAQMDAVQRLVIAGWSAQDAFNAVADTAFAKAVLEGPASDLEVLRKLNIETNNLKKNFESMDVEQLQQSFESKMSAIMDSFNVQQTALELKYKPVIDAQQTIIDNAEKSISKLNKQSGVIQDDLDKLDISAKSINDKYDRQIAALDEVAKLNGIITNQEKSRLTIADAITQGDIAAAARAIQDARSQSAQDFMQQAKESLTKSRDLEIAQLKNAAGLTRNQLEDQLKTIKVDIKKLEDETLIPAQERQQAVQKELEDQIKGITVLGQTKEQWNQIQSNVDLARINSDRFKDSIKDMLALVDELILKWKNLQSIKGGGDTGGVTGGSTSSFTNSEGVKVTVPNGPDKAWGIPASGNVSLPTPSAPVAIQNMGSTVPAATKKFLNTLGFGFNSGGMVPKYFASGGYGRGSDTIPAMLTPGEYVVRKSAVDRLGVNALNSINNGDSIGSSVYNYSLSVNVSSDANPEDIAKTVIAQIKQIDSQRIRGNRF
jgi:TP901 family phage tail tape measure protein